MLRAGRHSAIFKLTGKAKWCLITILLIFNFPAEAFNLSPNKPVQQRIDKSKKKSDAAAERAFAEAERMRLEWELQSFLRAIKSYEQALSYWRKTKEREKELVTLKRIGDLYLILSRNPQALDYYNQALDISRSTGNRQSEIDMLNSIGFASFDLKKQVTLEYCEKARVLSRDIGYKRGEAQALNHLGIYYQDNSDSTQALDALNQARVLWNSIPDISGLAEALNNMGNVYGEMGRPSKAAQYFEEALPLYKKANDRRGEALVLVSLGVGYISRGETQKALEAYTEAKEISRLLGDRRQEAVSLNGIGYVYETILDKQKALDSYNAALKIYMEIGQRNSEAFTLGNIGKIYGLMGNKEKALNFYNKKLVIIDVNDARSQAYTLKEIAEVFESAGDKDKAFDYYNRALKLSLKASDLRAQGYILNGLGHLYDSRRETDKALEHYAKSLELLRATEDNWGEIQVLRNIVLLKLNTDNLADAYNHIKTLLGLVEKLRTNAGGDELRSTYFASVRANYELYIDILMKMHKRNPAAGYDAAALGASESARARSLLDMLAEARANIRQGVDGKLSDTEISLQGSLDDARKQLTQVLSRKHTAEEAAALKQEIETLTDQHETIAKQLRASSPRYAALTKAEPLKATEIRELLDADTLLLEYLLGDEQSYLWAVTRNSISIFELPKRSEIEATAKTLYELITSRNLQKIGETPEQRRARLQAADAQYLQVASKLSEMLLKPVSSILGTKQLVIVADGALQYIPFQALPDPNNNDSSRDGWKPILMDHEIINLPSVSALAFLRREIQERESPSKTLAVLADPVFDRDDIRIINLVRNGKKKRRRSANSDNVSSQTELMRSAVEVGAVGENLRLQRLPSANREAHEITRLIPDSEFMRALGFDASHSTASNPKLGQYRIIHFATHGFLNSLHPELSGMVLSLFDKKGQPQDGFLRLNEIYGMRLPVEMVVLSACQTALGKEIRGEGLVGLTRGFMYAGAARVVASLWKVNDDASAELMKHFYDEMFGPHRLRPAAALRAAQIAVWKQRQISHPYYWAAFILQGEWR
jgi:CHAT domain-containing protein/Tfp pilus assembly protein PilF